MAGSKNCTIFVSTLSINHLKLKWDIVVKIVRITGFTLRIRLLSALFRTVAEVFVIRRQRSELLHFIRNVFEDADSLNVNTDRLTGTVLLNAELNVSNRTIADLNVVGPRLITDVNDLNGIVLYSITVLILTELPLTE